MGAAWVHVRGGVEEVASRHTKEVAFALVQPRRIFGPDQEAVRVHFCPGCGTKAPDLEEREGATSFHAGPYDDNGNCLTCRVRYCSGEDPSRAWRVRGA